MDINVKILLSRGMEMPAYATDGSAAVDLRAAIDEGTTVVIAPGETRKIPTGLAMEIPTGCAGLIYARSSLGTKRGLAPANKVGVVDSDYRGEFMIFLHNHGTEPQTVQHGDRVAQLLVTPVFTPGFVEADELSDTVRGSGGFGSTGR